MVSKVSVSLTSVGQKCCAGPHPGANGGRAEGRRHACRLRPLRNAIAPPRQQCGQLTEGEVASVLGARLCHLLSVSSWRGLPFLGPYNPLLAEREYLGSGIAKTIWPLHLRLWNYW